MRRSRFPASRRNGGFSLLEILTAVAVIGIALMGVLQLLTGSIRAQGANRDATLAAVALSNVLSARLAETKEAERTIGDGALQAPTVNRGKVKDIDLERLEAEAGWGPSGARKTLKMRVYHHIEPQQPSP